MSNENMFGISYKRPKVYLLNSNGLGVSEYAGRIAYDSFDKSENDVVKQAHASIYDDSLTEFEKFGLNTIDDSKLLHSLSWVHHHHSVIEHSVLTYVIVGTSRGVLQEHARHRIQSLTVQSTRYTMSNLINAFCVSLLAMNSEQWFIDKVLEFDMFVTTSENYNILQIEDIYNKLLMQYTLYINNDESFFEIALSKENKIFIEEKIKEEFVDIDEVFKIVQSGKKKRNVGDAFKHIVNDNWKVDMVVTFNLRSLKNYFDLRNSGAAYFQIKWLAEEMIQATPEKYLKLIIKNFKSQKEN